MQSKIVVVSLLIVLSVLVIMLSGCCCGFHEHPGKTAAEVHREHVNTLKINQQQLMRDIDRALLFDRPSRLTERQMP